MLPNVYLKQPGWVPLTFISLSYDTMQVTKQTEIASFQLYVNYQELQDFEVHQLVTGHSDTTLLYTSSSANFLLPEEVTTYRKLNLDYTPQSLETQQALYALCEEYQDIFSSHQGDISHTTLLTMDIDIGDYPSIVQKPYMLFCKVFPLGQILLLLHQRKLSCGSNLRNIHV